MQTIPYQYKTSNPCACNMGVTVVSQSNSIFNLKPNTTQFLIFPAQLAPVQLRALLHLLNGNQGTKKLICLFNVEHALTRFMPKSVRVTLARCGMLHWCLNYLYKVSDTYHTNTIRPCQERCKQAKSLWVAESNIFGLKNMTQCDCMISER